ncbi:helix-turn-helix domain-containing protein [Conchiformibius steedae DSM 2580]|uniref:Helix-turn-helix domain-containing protein n=1 Tax=Conchiformibius steedae DSM 2580 TaxID=1121352 RepID=A0AAE9HWZ8_9NEIS|nr:helix-turn-helix domain-containing protein [Conchiformibius steedae]QMT33484.1 helix-turn-helix domain-containing protein [Conchiformibius steedae]URD68141.1 helix-turn-helix domain-containing protein [Conchiformibius steedae DSM 2580]
MSGRCGLLPDARREFAANLAELLAEKGWRNIHDKEMAQKIGEFCQVPVSGQTVHYWRKGSFLPRQDWFDRLADWLDCEPHDLLSPQYQSILQQRSH